MKFLTLIFIITLASSSYAQYSIEYKFDEIQRIKEEKYPDGTTVTYTYDPVSNRKTKVVNRVVAGQPDITLVNSSLSVSSIVVGNNLTVSTTVSNLQTTAANPNFKLRYYLSDNNLYEATDTELGTFQTITSPFTGTQNLQNVITIPTGQVGSKYIIIRVDADNEVTNEVSETNNEVALAIQITVPCGIISVEVNTTNANNGGSNGSATAVASGGQIPYNFLWNNGGTSSIINNLSSGNYSVSVTDANGCQGAGNGVVTNLNVCNLAVTASTTEASCTSSDGAIDLSVSGGTMPYSYVWSNGASTQDLVNVASNDYFVEITDANQCKTTANFWVGIKRVVVSMDTIILSQKIYASHLNVQYALLENTSSSKLVLSDFQENTGTLNFQSINLETKTNENLSFLHPSGDRIKKWGISSVGDTLILLNHHIINGIPEGANLTQFKMVNGQLSMLKDLKYVNTRWYVDENIPTVYPALHIKTYKDKGFIFDRSTTWVGTNGSQLGKLEAYDMNTGATEIMQYHEIWPLNENSFVKDKTKNNRFLSVVSKITSENPKIGIHEILEDGTIPDYSVRSVKKIPFHIQTTKQGIFILSISKTLDSLFIESYDKDFNLLNFSFLSKRRTIYTVSAGYSTSGKSILSIIGVPDGSPNTKILFWDCENHKIISDQSYYWGNISDREDGVGLFYSENQAKFYSIHKKWKYQSQGNIDENRLVSFQINDGPSIHSQITDTPYNTSNGAVDLTLSGGGATFLWSNGAITEDVSGLAEGTYSVTITPVGGGCPIVRSFQIKTNTAPPAPIVSAPDGTKIIENSGGAKTLTASGCIGIITWSTGETTKEIKVSPNQATTYTATCSYNGYTSETSLPITISMITPCLSMISVASGLWNDPLIWSCSRIPDLNDDVTIAVGHTIIIPKDYEAFSKNMDDYGNLLLNINSVLTLGNPNNLNSGLVLYLPLNGNAQDLSGNNNHGTVFGANLVTDRHGNENRAYRFDGIDDWIEVQNSTSLNTQNITISAWIKPYGWYQGECKANYILTKGWDGDQNYGLAYMSDLSDACNNQPQSAFVEGLGPSQYFKTNTPPNTIISNVWQHIVGTFDGNKMNIYLDGILISSKPFSGNLTANNQSIYIGRNSPLNVLSNAYPYLVNGNIDDIRVFNRALNLNEVSLLYNLEKPKLPTSGLLAWYDFNGDLQDKSGNNNHASSPVTKTFFSGINKLAVKINGTGNVGTTGEFLSVPPLMTTINSNYSISVWVKEDGMSHFHGDGYIWFGDHYGPHIGIGHMLENIEFLNQTNFNDPSGRITIPFQNQWLRKYNHYLMTFENGKLKCFINGVKVGEKQNLPNVLPNNNAGMGTHWFIPDASNRFIGNFDNTRIYNRTLTEEEVSIIYNEEKSKVTDNQLVAYYPFNGNAEDESNAGNHLVNTNATILADRNSTPNSAFYFNGTSKLISPNVSYFYNKSFTISFWAKPDTYTGQMFIRSGPPATSAALHIALRNENIFTFAFYFNDFDFTNFKKDNNWHNYTLIYDKDLNLRMIYEDGIFLESQACLTPLNAQNTPLILGYSWYDNYLDHLKGYLDDVRIYDRALYEHEVKAIYEFEK